LRPVHARRRRGAHRRPGRANRRRRNNARGQGPPRLPGDSGRTSHRRCRGGGPGRLLRRRADAGLRRRGIATNDRRSLVLRLSPGRGELRPARRRRRDRRSTWRSARGRGRARRRDPVGPQRRRHVGGAMKLGLSGVLTRTFITSPLTPLLLLAALVAGALAVFSLPREEEPQISVPMVDILVSANGYKADEAVELVTRPLEDIVKGIDGVEHVYSQTQD